MLYPSHLSFPLVFLFPHARLLPWQAVCRGSPSSMATSHPLSEEYAHMICHSTTNHLLVLTHAGIGSIDPFASVTTPNPCEFEARHSHSIPESYLEYHRQGLDFPDSQECCQWILAYTTKILIKESKRYSFNRR